ncbi:laminin subunit alpha-3 [Euwallacea fornicatus]|uniref:laminin subunit alpha-3 n=1 Tax=Euwallacea fornicatus TaxID=995702 RepID=UPI00338DE1ED
MKLFYLIILLKKPEPKNLLSKHLEINKYRKWVQEIHVLLKNIKEEINDLDQQITELETRNRDLAIRLGPRTSMNIANEHELESLQFLRKKQEIQMFYKDLMKRYEKAQEVIEHYDRMYEALMVQALENEGIINSLNEECAKLKEQASPVLIRKEKPKSSLKQNFKSLLIKTKVQKECPKFIYQISQRIR